MVLAVGVEGGYCFGGSLLFTPKVLRGSPPQDLFLGGDFEQTFKLQNDAFGKPGKPGPMRELWGS